jgi:hypothetical protein
MRPAVEHHLRALETYAAKNPVLYLNSFETSAPRPGTRIGAIVLHTTFLTQRWGDWFGLFKQRFDWIADLDCAKLAIPQDEYDHPEILDEWLFELGVRDIFTNFAAHDRRRLYPLLAGFARYYECLTGYIDPKLADEIAQRGIPPLPARPNDVIYRASNLPYWFGLHGQMKHRIGEESSRAARRLGLEANISTRYADVITGDAWFDFLMSGRAVIGAESGSSAIDRRGEIQTSIRAMLVEEPDLTFDDVVQRLPPGWDGHQLTAISPRHFEAIVTKTAQILVRGRFSGVLSANDHYIPVDPDLSNLEAALEQSRDPQALTAMTECAYEEIYRSGRYTYERFAQQLAAVIDTSEAVAKMPRVQSRRAAAANAGLVAVERRFGVTRRLRHTPNHARGTTANLQQPSTPQRGALHHPMIAQQRFRARLVRAIWSTLLHNPPLRRICFSITRRVSRPALLRDLVRLAVLDAHGRLERTDLAQWHSRLEQEGDTLFIRSVTSDTPDAPPQLHPMVVRRVTWDHSRIGTSVPFFPLATGQGSLALGEDGIYEFAELSRIATSRPDLVVGVFESLLGGDACVTA